MNAPSGFWGLKRPLNQRNINDNQRKKLWLESLEPRVLLSALDFADRIIDEAEPNDDDSLSQQITFDSANDILAIGINGSLASSNDIDYYEFQVGPEGQAQIKFEIPEGMAQEITALAPGPNDLVYFIANNSLWREVDQDDSNTAEQIIDTATLANALGIDPESLDISGAAVDADGNIAIANGGDILLAEPTEEGFELKFIVTAAEVTGQTLADTADLTSIAFDGNGNLFMVDQASQTILQAVRQEPEDPEQEDPEIEFATEAYATAAHLQEAIRTDVLVDIDQGVTPMPQTDLATTLEDFGANAVVLGSGSYGPGPGEGQVYYVSQLGPDYDGTGGITRIVTNEEDPASATFEAFFTPSDSQLDLNPSALALDTGGSFGGQLFMGTFGPSLGDDQDGQLYTVDSDGQITLFEITEYVDGDGDPVMKDGEAVTGFFDVTDLAFSFGGPFGSYLYVISENVDSNGEEDGGFGSDIWRVSPNGTAELFVENIADGAIALAFDDSFNYGNDLFVTTFTGGAKVIRVDSDGTSETFFDFSQFGASLALSDIDFVAALPDQDHPLEGRMVVTLKGSSTFVVELDPDGVQFQTWASGLSTGDVSAGDIVFNDQGELIVLQAGETKGLTQLEYQTIFDQSLGELRIRTQVDEVPVEGGEEGETEEVTTYVPYVLVNVADQPRIMRIGGDSVDDIITEVSPSVLDQGEPGDDGLKEITYTFDADGDIYVLIQNTGLLSTSARSDSGLFNQFSNIASTAQVDDAAELTDSQIDFLITTTDGRIVARATNGTEVEQGQDLPDQIFDDTIIVFGTAGSFSYSPSSLIQVRELTRMQVSITGPGTDTSFEMAAGSIQSEFLEDITPGTYTIVVQSALASSGDYELVVSTQGDLQQTFNLREVDGGLTFTTIDDEIIQLTITGPGEIELIVNQKPSGTLVSLETLTIVKGSGATDVRLVNLTNETNMELSRIILAAPIGSLKYIGTLDTLTQSGNRGGVVTSITLGDVREVTASNYTFKEFVAINLGSSEEDDNLFRARRLDTLAITQDMTNITVLRSTDKNTYHEITVGGTINNCTVYGKKLKDLIIGNTDQAENAMVDTTFNFSQRGGIIYDVDVLQGDVKDSSFSAYKKILDVEIAEGDLVDSVITARQRIKRVFVEGEVSEQAYIAANSLRSSAIDEVITGGSFNGTLETIRINNLRVGYDSEGQRVAEPVGGGFTGADLTGVISSVFSIKEINVTGQVSGATINCSLGGLDRLFAEDGLDATIQTNKQVNTLMVGFLDGKRSQIVNEQANVSGTVSAPKLNRLYYTGTLDSQTLLPSRSAVIRDDVS